jgi:hypothetical protein
MKKITHILVSLVFLIFLTGCFRSDAAFYTLSDGATPLQGEFGFFEHSSTKSAYWALSTDGKYAIQPTEAFDETLVIPLKGRSDYFILQFLHGGQHSYRLVQLKKAGLFSKGKMTLLELEKDKLLKSGQFLGLELRENKGYFINSKEELENIFKYALQAKYYKIEDTYEIFDLSKPKQQEDFATLLIEANKFSDIRFTGQDQHQPKIDTGNWYYANSVDVMTDKKLPVIQGEASQFSGTAKAPLLKIACSAKTQTPYIEIQWGVSLEPMDRTAQAQIVFVDLRFGEGEVQKTVWIPSANLASTYEASDEAKGMLQFSLAALSMFRPDLANASISWTTEQVANNMAATKRLVIRAPSVNGPDVTAVFDTTGFVAAWKELQRNCN